MGDVDLSAVSETLFLTLYAVATEAASPTPIVADPGAVRLAARIDETLAGSPRRLHRMLVARRLPRTLVTTLALRTRHFDQIARDFLARHPDAVVVSLGSGLSDRARRVDDGRVRWFDVDLPPVTALRRRLVPETDRFRAIAASVLDPAWADALPREPGARFLFLAEGLFMYLEPDDVRRLVVALRERFPGSELVAEFALADVVRLSAGRLGRGKLRRRFGLSEDVWFRSGLADAREVEAWAPGIERLDDWSWFDEDEPRLGWMRWLARWRLFGRALFVARYRLG